MAKETINFEELITKVQQASVGRNSINMAVKGTEIILQDFAKEDGEEYVYFTTEKNKEYRLHLLSFASMRITDNASKVKAKWSNETSSDPEIASLKDTANSKDGFKFEKGMKFEIVKRIQILDNFAKDNKPQLATRCYEGYNDYVEKTTEITASKDKPEEKRAQYQHARTVLYQSGVKDAEDYKNDKLIQHVPIFKLSE